MQSTPDFADEYFSLPPLDILIAVQPDESIHRLARQLEEGCHHVVFVSSRTNAFVEADAQAPDVMLIDASTAEGVALARRIRARFGERIVLVGQCDATPPSAFAPLFDYLLSKPVSFTSFAQALGLIPEHELHTATLGHIHRGKSLQTEAFRRAA